MNNTINTKKYKDIFKTGKELFWKYGIKRVTIEEVCREAKVSKMTFYKFFPNKIELAKTIFEFVIGDSLKKFDQLVHSELSFPDKIKEMFIMKLEGTKDVSVEFIKDIYGSSDLGLRQYAEKQQQISLAVFVDFLKDSQSKGLIRKEIKIDFILFYIKQMSQMLEDEHLVSKYKNPQELIMESMSFLFYGLLPKE